MNSIFKWEGNIMAGAVAGSSCVPDREVLQAVQGCSDLVRVGTIFIEPITAGLPEAAVEAVERWAKTISTRTKRAWKEKLSPEDIAWISRLERETTEVQRAEVLQSTSPAAFEESHSLTLRLLPSRLRPYAKADDDSLQKILALFDS